MKQSIAYGFGYSRRFKAACYAVLRGRKPGIYTDWETAKAQVHRYSDHWVQKFETREAGKSWLLENVCTVVQGGSNGKKWHVCGGKVFSCPIGAEDDKKIAIISDSGSVEVEDKGEPERENNGWQADETNGLSK